MSLINYVEPFSVGEAFLGLGSLIVALVVAYIVYRLYIKFIEWFDVIINREAKYEILEESFLDKIGKAKGIDLTKELVKRRMFRDANKKSFRRKVEEQIYEDMFGKAKETKKE